MAGDPRDYQKTDLTIETLKVFDTNVLRLYGDLTWLGEHVLKDAFQAAAESGANILIDLSHVTAIDTSGIGVLIMVVMETRKQGRIILVSGISPQYRNIFELVRFALYARFFDTEENALASIG